MPVAAGSCNEVECSCCNQHVLSMTIATYIVIGVCIGLLFTVCMPKKVKKQDSIESKEE